MEINLTCLQQYSDKKGYSINIEINIEPPYSSVLRIVKGKYEQNGDTAVHLDYKDFKEILLLNNVLGEKGLLKAERENLSSDLRRGVGIRNKHEEKIDDLIYGTVLKYLTQMLNAASGKIFYPEIKPLEKHKEIYFKNEQNISL